MEGPLQRGPEKPRATGEWPRAGRQSCWDRHRSEERSGGQAGGVALALHSFCPPTTCKGAQGPPPCPRQGHRGRPRGISALPTVRRPMKSGCQAHSLCPEPVAEGKPPRRSAPREDRSNDTEPMVCEQVRGGPRRNSRACPSAPVL